MEDESFLAAKARKKKGSQGKAIEDKVHTVLRELRAAHVEFDYERLPDSRSAGRPMPATVADFVGVCNGRGFALEVKSTSHDFRLAGSDFPQFSRMRRRAQAGALCLVAVYHSTIKKWRLVDVSLLPLITRGSFDLSEYLLWDDFKTPFMATNILNAKDWR